jgi:hypothetical protein
MNINIGSMSTWEFIGFIMICLFVFWLIANGFRVLADLPTREEVRKIIREELDKRGK